MILRIWDNRDNRNCFSEEDGYARPKWNGEALVGAILLAAKIVG